ncbi:MAG TPA: diaminopimelate epimerase [Methanocorpusculum sp.]|nr:diaminopimelate epimerase [Methanocorpusculum sp.]
MSISFTKMHGNGNDFVIIDEMNAVVIPQEMKPEFAKAYCDRKFGIGADGILFISKPETDGAAVRMQLFQPDGSEAAMCGNGIRCLAKYAVDKEYAKTKAFKVQTKAGVLSVRGDYDSDGDYMVSIDMGKAVFGNDEKIADLCVSSVNTGVPHAVVFVENVDDVDIDTIAPKIRNNPVYPEGTNVNFVQITGTDEITIRTYERGVEGETLSCGTGATASALAASAKKLVSGSIIHVATVGGPLDITVSGKTPVMTGPAETVYTGEISF